jgi:hypothetical protein
VLSLTRPRLQGHIVLAWRARQQPGPAAQAFLARAARAIGPPIRADNRVWLGSRGCSG